MLEGRVVSGLPCTQDELVEASPVSQGELPSTADHEPESTDAIQAAGDLQAAPAAVEAPLIAAVKVEPTSAVEAISSDAHDKDPSIPVPAAQQQEPPGSTPWTKDTAPATSSSKRKIAATGAGTQAVPVSHTAGDVAQTARSADLPPVPKLPVASIPAGPLAGGEELSARTPASERSAGSGATPGEAPSDEPPKRKRLGWGQVRHSRETFPQRGHS